MSLNEPAFQDRMSFNHCWGCGADNPEGFQLKSRWQGAVAVAEWRPWPAHKAGPEHVLNGGVIATLLDCHAICTAVADGYAQEGQEIGEGELIWYVTGSLNVTFLKPTPLHAPVHLEATVRERAGRKTWIEAALLSGGEPRARAEVLAVRVRPEWLEAS